MPELELELREQTLQDQVVQPRQRHELLGIALILGVACLWVGASFIMKTLFTTGDYQKPFFLTFVNTSAFLVYLLPFVWRRLLLLLMVPGGSAESVVEEGTGVSDSGEDAALLSVTPKEPRSVDPIDGMHAKMHAKRLEVEPNYCKVLGRQTDTSGSGPLAMEGSTTKSQEETLDISVTLPTSATSTTTATPTKPLSTRKTIRLSLRVCLLWFLLVNASLTLTNVASATVLTATSCTFSLTFLCTCLPTYMMDGSLLDVIDGCLDGRGTVSYVEIASYSGFVCAQASNHVHTCYVATWRFGRICGVVLVSTAGLTKSEPESTVNDWRGDLMALASAVFYGIYVTGMKVQLNTAGPHVHLDMYLFFGTLGAWNMVLLFPLFPLLHYTGWEPFEWPPTPTVWLGIAVNAFLGTVLSELAWLKALAYTSPLVVTMGLSLTIPLAIAGDIFWSTMTLSVQYWVGALLVLAGFLGVQWRHS